VVRVLYIAGSGRSGSTIVDNILGQADGVVNVGEVRFLWERGVLGDRLCGCGEPFSTCPYWQPVMASVGDVDAARMASLLARGTRARHVPWLVRARRNPAAVVSRLEELPAVLGRLYAAIAENARARVIVDSSKLPPYGEVLRHVPGIDISYVHLVRDPRATAHSWSRAKPLPERDGGVMQRQGPAKSAALWTLWNAAAEGLWRGEVDRYLRVRYEDVIADPRPALARMLALVGEPADDLPFVSDHEVQLRPAHGVAGNPSRFTTGVVALRADAGWRDAMRTRDRALVAAISSPLLLRHGYLGRAPAASP
jgi:hypothetical protein